MTKKIRAGVVAAALAAVTMIPVAPASASHSCAFEDDNGGGDVDRLCESHPDELLRYVLCLITKSC